jgi:carnitine 3-dehydrogenase
MLYRLAGGEAGMRHFVEQFGPALRWPWTKLTDVPELTDELLDRLVAQSDAQAAGRSIRDLEHLRDDCLVSVLQALRANGAGAGAVLEEWEQRLFLETPSPSAVDETQPLRLHTASVIPEWLDYNGHMTESRYLQVFGDSTDALLRYLGIDMAYVSTVGSYFAVETHLSHLRQAAAGEPLHVTTLVLGHDEKRLHVFHSLYRTSDGELLATAEQMLVHVGAAEGRAAQARPDVRLRVARLSAAHAAVERPSQTGRRIGDAPTRPR